MKFTKKLNLFAVLLNVYYLAGWIYVFNRYSVPQERYDAFRSLFGGLNLGFIDLFLIAITIISFIFIVGVRNRYFRFLVITSHLIFLGFVLWSHL